MILALIPPNLSLAGARRDSGSAPAHLGDVKIEFLAECIQKHGEKAAAGSGAGMPQWGPPSLSVFFSASHFRLFLLSRRRAFKDCVPYLGLRRFDHMFHCQYLWDS